MMPRREIGPYLRELWHRPAGPMNWKNPIRVFAVAGWLVVQGFVLLGWAGFRVFHSFMLVGWVVLRVGQFVAGLPPLLLFFFAALGWAGWSFVHRPFPPLDEHPILVLVEYHTPNFFDAMVVWYYVTPFAVVMLTGFISVTIWRVWLEGRRSDFASSSKLPPWPLDPQQKAPAIVIGEVHHPVEAREVFNPEWLTIPERGLYTGVAIFGAVGSGKTSACMNPFARQLLGWQAGNERKRAAALILEVKGDFCHDIRQILVRGGPWTRLHRAWHERPLSMESALGLVARFVLAGLHRFEPSQSAIRQGQRTFLAASLYQSGPLDHRALPRVPGSLGDVATGLPLRHRPRSYLRPRSRKPRT